MLGWLLSSALLFNPWVLSFMESLREESELSLFDDLGHGNHGVTNKWESSQTNAVSLYHKTSAERFLKY